MPDEQPWKDRRASEKAARRREQELAPPEPETPEERMATALERIVDQNDEIIEALGEVNSNLVNLYSQVEGMS